MVQGKHAARSAGRQTLFSRPVFGYALPAIERVHDAEAWAPKECRITSARVRPDFGENATYKPHVTYTWEVDGTTYSGTQFSFIDFSPSESEGQRVT